VRCAGCVTEIPAPRRGQRFCSGRCRWAAWKAGRDQEAARLRAQLAEARAALDGVRRLAELALRRPEPPR
jgi:hypothetical protein